MHWESWRILILAAWLLVAGAVGACSRQASPVQPSAGAPPVFFYHRMAHTFDRDGRRIVGPAYRDLDRFPVQVAGDAVVVDTRTILQGQPRATEGAGCFP